MAARTRDVEARPAERPRKLKTLFFPLAASTGDLAKQIDDPTSGVPSLIETAELKQESGRPQLAASAFIRSG